MRANFNDLTGRRFESLVVLRRVEDHTLPSGERKTKWLCKCDCGNTLKILSENLSRGRTKSCGCKSSRGKGGRRLVVDMTGFVIGDLTVIGFSRIKNNSETTVAGAYWICKCSCGNIVEVAGSSLRRENTTSCGCAKRGESLVAVRLKQYLKEKYSAVLEYRIFKNPDTNRWLPYDVYIPSGIYIEINGKQHYVFSKWYKNQEEFSYRKTIDGYKKEYAERNGLYIEVDLRKTKTFSKAVEYVENKISMYHLG